MHEASLHEENCFITLTYAPKHLPSGGSLNKRHFQLFMKRLRKRTKQKIRFFHCGEYGEKLSRPHYHALLFGYDFPDKTFWREHRGNRIYRSSILEKTWTYGHSDIGGVTFQSAAYVARYMLKKITGELADQHYLKLNEETGELCEVVPEYATMSRRPGIAHAWFEKFSSDVFPDDFVVVDGKKLKTPKYYMQLLEKIDPDTHKAMKLKRKRHSERESEDNTHERLDVRQTVLEARMKNLIRNLEEN